MFHTSAFRVAHLYLELRFFANLLVLISSGSAGVARETEAVLPTLGWPFE